MPYIYLRKIQKTERVIPFFFLGCALWLLSHDVFDSVEAYRQAAFLTEYQWASIFSFTGGFQLLAGYSKLLSYRRKALFLSTIILFFWTVLIAAAGTKGFGSITYSTLTLLCAFNYWEIRPPYKPSWSLRR